MNHDIVLERGMPHNPEAERMILGVILLDNVTISQAMERLKPSDFYRPANQMIFSQMLVLESKGDGIDPLTLEARLFGAGQLEMVGGPAYIASLFDGVPRFSNIESYVSLVEDCAIRRKQIAAGNLAVQLAYDFEQSAQVQLNAAQKHICDIQSVDSRQSWAMADSVGYDVLTRMEEQQNSGKMLTGIGTGFHEFDSMTAGLQRTELIVIGGRPKMGKTAFVGSLILGAASLEANRKEDGKPPVIGFFSLEMGQQQIVQRWMCALAEVDSMRARNGMLLRNEWAAMSRAAAELERYQISIDDSSMLTPTMMRSRLRQLQQERSELDLVVLDYLQMMTPDKRSESTVREVSEITRALKAIAKDFNVPVVALASLSRKCEERADKRPIPSDLRESGNIESDADVIAFIYRDAVYNPEAEPLTAELILRNQRNGPVGTVNLIFKGRYTKFENLPVYSEASSYA